jgi:hypothetical protein
MLVTEFERGWFSKPSTMEEIAFVAKSNESAVDDRVYDGANYKVSHVPTLPQT